jgi:TetR/AcrR family transcriptional regulator, transcriptional repressor for nem operon
MAQTTGRPIRDELVASALELAQTIGIESFSYADVAQKVGIKTASIHHHFRFKHDLVAEILRRYRIEFNARANELARIANAEERLHAYAVLFAQVASQGRMCLCGISAAEWSSIGREGQHEVTAFLHEQRDWLRTTLVEGIDQALFQPDLEVKTHAELLLVALEGAILLARARNETPSATDVMDHAIRLIRSGHP